MAVTSGWYNDSDYSDLTLKLKDDREIKVHKIVICKSNEFFRGLCGVGSGFAESSQKTISLPNDDPDVVEEILRRIYGCTLVPWSQKPWEFWSSLVITADKYLEPTLSADAGIRLRSSGRALTDGDAIFDFIATIKRDMSHLEPFLQFADQLRKANLKTLLDNERYRALLDGDKALLWSHLDELKALAGLVQGTCSVCPRHNVPITLKTKQPGVAKCFVCKQDSSKTLSVWISK